MKTKKPWLWITDPWNTLDHAQDTTLRLMQAAHTMGQPVYWSSVKSIRWENGKVVLDAARMHRGAISSAARVTSPAKFSQIHYRVDPPVDLAYLHPLQMLEQVASKAIVNPARAIVLLSEKTLGSSMPGLAPRSVVSCDPSRLLDFIQKEKVAVLKPLHTAQSKGVMRLEASTPLAKLTNIIQDATDGFSRPVQLQQYLSKIIQEGEVRLWFVDGRLLACARKLPASGQFRVDMDQGGTLAAARIPARHRGRVQKISKILRAHQIRLAAVDWIDGWVTDFNITSPGLIVGMEKLLERDLASEIIRSLQSKPKF